MTTTRGARVGTVVKVALAIGALLVAQSTGLLGAIVELRDELLYLSQQHVLLVAISGGFAILTGIPIGMWLSRPGMRGKAEMLMQVLSVGTTIPTLAVLALSMSFLGIGAPPALLRPVGRFGVADCPEHLCWSKVVAQSSPGSSAPCMGMSRVAR